MMNAVKQDIDLWEVWIEFDQSHPEYFGTLYIHGEIELDKKISLSLMKANAEENRRLSLHLPPRSRGFYSKEVLYSEPVKNIDQYTSVCIYAGHELIGFFDDIEIMI